MKSRDSSSQSSLGNSAGQMWCHSYLIFKLGLVLRTQIVWDTIFLLKIKTKKESNSVKTEHVKGSFSECKRFDDK